jgi:pilus assembly protein CpaE
MTVPALRAAQRALSIFQRLGYPDDKVCIVVNRFQANDVLSTTDAVSVLKRDVFWKLPNDYRTSAAALTKGVPVAEYDASSKLANSYSQLAAKLGGTSVGQRTNGHSEQGSSRLRKMLGISKRS